jgi:purine-binding chemotaxis protein CheW
MDRRLARDRLNATEGCWDPSASDADRTQTVYAQRAARLAAPAVLSDSLQDLIQVMVFRLGEERYGIELRDVAEVITAISAARVPGAPAHFAGVIAVRGEIRPVLDLRRMLEMPAPDRSGESGGPAHVLLLRLAGSQVAVQTDGVERVRLIGRNELHVPGAQTGSAHSPYVRASTTDALMLLSTTALLAEFFKETSCK